jgi:predicted nuclease of predicted toxin-antitoxin system
VKLLLDENLSARLVGLLSDLYPGSSHVTVEGLAGASDEALWVHAARHGFALVTKDEDFHRLSVLRGAPPKVIWVRLGNCATADVARLLRFRAVQIVDFIEDADATFLALG